MMSAGIAASVVDVSDGSDCAEWGYELHNEQVKLCFCRFSITLNLTTSRIII